MDEKLFDNVGRLIATIKDRGNKQVLELPNGKQLGYFQNGKTYEMNGRQIGVGNLLVTLLPRK